MHSVYRRYRSSALYIWIAVVIPLLKFKFSSSSPSSKAEISMKKKVSRPLGTLFSKNYTAKRTRLRPRREAWPGALKHDFRCLSTLACFAEPWYKGFDHLIAKLFAFGSMVFLLGTDVKAGPWYKGFDLLVATIRAFSSMVFLLGTDVKFELWFNGFDRIFDAKYEFAKNSIVTKPGDFNQECLLWRRKKNNLGEKKPLYRQFSIHPLVADLGYIELLGNVGDIRELIADSGGSKLIALPKKVLLNHPKLIPNLQDSIPII